MHGYGCSALKSSVNEGHDSHSNQDILSSNKNKNLEVSGIVSRKPEMAYIFCTSRIFSLSSASSDVIAVRRKSRSVSESCNKDSSNAGTSEASSLTSRVISVMFPVIHVSLVPLSLLVTYIHTQRVIVTYSVGILIQICAQAVSLKPGYQGRALQVKKE